MVSVVSLDGGMVVSAEYKTSDAGGDDNAWKVGARYTLGNFGLYGQYEGDGRWMWASALASSPATISSAVATWW